MRLGYVHSGCSKAFHRAPATGLRAQHTCTASRVLPPSRFSSSLPRRCCSPTVCFPNPWQRDVRTYRTHIPDYTTHGHTHHTISPRYHTFTRADRLPHETTTGQTRARCGLLPTAPAHYVYTAPLTLPLCDATHRWRTHRISLPRARCWTPRIRAAARVCAYRARHAPAITLSPNTFCCSYLRTFRYAGDTRWRTISLFPAFIIVIRRHVFSLLCVMVWSPGSPSVVLGSSLILKHTGSGIPTPGYCHCRFTVWFGATLWLPHPTFYPYPCLPPGLPLLRATALLPIPPLRTTHTGMPTPTTAFYLPPTTYRHHSPRWLYLRGTRERCLRFSCQIPTITSTTVA